MLEQSSLLIVKSRLSKADRHQADCCSSEWQKRQARVSCFNEKCVLYACPATLTPIG